MSPRRPCLLPLCIALLWGCAQPQPQAPRRAENPTSVALLLRASPRLELSADQREMLAELARAQEARRKKVEAQLAESAPPAAMPRQAPPAGFSGRARSPGFGPPSQTMGSGMAPRRRRPPPPTLNKKPKEPLDPEALRRALREDNEKTLAKAWRLLGDEQRRRATAVLDEAGHYPPSESAPSAEGSAPEAPAETPGNEE